MSKVRYIVEDEQVSREVQAGAKWLPDSSKKSTGMINKLGAPISLGLMPPGLRLFEQIGQYTQVAIECPPMIARMAYSRYDAGNGASRYGGSGIKGHALCAMPWRVILARYNGMNMIGARMFYRPAPLQATDNLLYHTNLPNINCVGYGGTSVGWVCFYHQGVDKDWPTTLEKLIFRCSGGEGYNNNMTETDGPHFYQKQGGPKWRYSVSEWEKLTNKHGLKLGIEGTDGEFPWIPVKVTSNKSQLSHSNAASAKPLTLDVALSGKAPFYYSDDGIWPPTSVKTDATALFQGLHHAYSTI
jgi:hypothetical protein